MQAEKRFPTKKIRYILRTDLEIRAIGLSFLIMEFVVYILYSEKFGKTYTGFTTDLINRMRSHNQFAAKGFTYRYRPWTVVYLEWFATKKEAMQRERIVQSVFLWLQHPYFYPPYTIIP